MTKAELLLKIAGLDYDIDLKGFGKAPKGKLPYIRDDGETIADFDLHPPAHRAQVRLRLRRRGERRREGLRLGLQKMCEDHLYWIMVDARWLDDGNFARGPAKFFDAAPAPVRPVVKAYVRRGLRRTLHGQGLGRHSAEERAELGRRDLEALAAILGDKPYLFGDAPRGVDATVAPSSWGAWPRSSSRRCARPPRPNANLVAYAERMTKRYYPDFAA